MKKKVNASGSEQKFGETRIYDSEPAELAGDGEGYGYATHKRRNVETIIFIAVFAVLAIATVAILAVIFYEPNLQVDPPFSTESTTTADPAVDPTDTTDKNGDVVVDPPQYVRDENKVNFLVIGEDKISGSTDVMMIVHLDIKTNNITITQIPRDTLITVDGRRKRVNTLYVSYYGKTDHSLSMNERSAIALKQVEEKLEQSLCIGIDYYAKVDLDAFVKIVDAIGGVYLDVPFDMFYEDPYQDLYIDIKEGAQYLDGKKAMQFIRFRSGYATADVGRTDAQKLFFVAFLESLKKNFNVETVAKLCSTVFNYVETDISLNDAIYFARAVLKVNFSEMKMLTMAGDGVFINGASYYILNRKAALLTVNTYLNIFSNEITDSIFDPDKAFNYEDDEGAAAIYNGDGYDSHVYTGNKVDDIVVVPIG